MAVSVHYNMGLDAARNEAIELLKNYRSHSKSVQILHQLMKKGGALKAWLGSGSCSFYLWSTARRLSLETAKNPVALMSCCGVPIDLAEEGPKFCSIVQSTVAVLFQSICRDRTSST